MKITGKAWERTVLDLEDRNAELEQEVEDLKAEIKDSEGNPAAGKEAEELREALEAELPNMRAPEREVVTRILDEVDARDSFAYLSEKRALGKVFGEKVHEHAQFVDRLAEAANALFGSDDHAIETIKNNTAELARLRARVESLQAALWLTAEDWMFVRHKEHGHPAGKCLVMAEDELKLLVICSDTFAYSCADCEEAELSETVALRRIAETEGFPGVVRWCQAKGQRGEPIEPVRKSMATFDSLREDNERLRAELEDYKARVALFQKLRPQ